MNNNDKVYNISSVVSSEDVAEAADKMVDEASVIGRSTVTKFCLTIFACSVVKTVGRVIIARNYAKRP